MPASERNWEFATHKSRIAADSHGHATEGPGVNTSTKRSLQCVRRILKGACGFAAATVAALVLAPSQAAAQPVPPAMAADRAMPLFSVLDSSMMSVEHDSPVHATTITFFSTLRHDDLMPRDIGVEFLPFLAPPLTATLISTLTPEALSERLGQERGWWTLRQYLAASLGISQGVDIKLDLDVKSDTLSRVSIGVRTFIVAGRLNPQTLRLAKRYVSASADLAAAESARIAKPGKEADDNVGMQYLLVNSLARQIADASKSHVGFLLEAGGALALDVPANTLNAAEIGRAIYWLSPIYRFERRPFDVAGVVRLVDEQERDLRRLDMGGRISVKRNGVGYSLEAIGRITPADESDHYSGRLVGGVAFGFSRSTQLHFTFGKNFENDFSHGGSLLASFGLAIGLGEIPLITTPDGR